MNGAGLSSPDPKLDTGCWALGCRRDSAETMALHIDIEDPGYRDAAAQILLRHDNFQPEANSTSAVRDFLILTGLARSDAFIEFKRRVGTTTGGEPDPENVQQLDDYLAQSAEQGRVRMGVLTDGKRWLLRWPGAGEVRLTRPYAAEPAAGD